MSFNILRNQYISLIKPLNVKSFKKIVMLSSPLRVNFSAGWNDTPPYCNEVSGYTLNVPISYKNKLPINVQIEKIDFPKIILSSNRF